MNPDGTIKDKETKLFGEEEYVVNIGPQHPATHGVMRFRVSLEGEIIRKIDANCGYIHRGIEKMNESLTYPQTLALTDRLDYLGIFTFHTGTAYQNILNGIIKHVSHVEHAGDVRGRNDDGVRLTTIGF